MKIIKLLLLCSVLILIFSCKDNNNTTVEVFYKNKTPSLKTLEKVNITLEDFKDIYLITYYEITDTESMEIIQRYNLPDTHFPFAVLINGKYSIEIKSKKIDFVHFPIFMHGIGRHEGNWSLEDMRVALENPHLLLEENTLPILEEDENETECYD